MKYILFAGSLRTESLNKKLIAVAAQLLKAQGSETTVVDIRDLSIPVYDGDIESAGFPEGVKKLGQLIQDADALVIGCPEYNTSIPGPLKNTIDWVSRLRPTPLGEKPTLLIGASPGGFGAIRSLGAMRSPLETNGSYVYPQVFALPKAHEQLATGDLADAEMKKRLADLLSKFESFAKRFKK